MKQGTANLAEDYCFIHKALWPVSKARRQIAAVPPSNSRPVFQWCVCDSCYLMFQWCVCDSCYLMFQWCVYSTVVILCSSGVFVIVVILCSSGVFTQLLLYCVPVVCL